MKGHWHQWRDIYHTANRCAHWTCAALTFRGTPGHSHIDHTENTVSGHYPINHAIAYYRFKSSLGVLDSY